MNAKMPVLENWKFDIVVGQLVVRGDILNDTLTHGYHPFRDGERIRTSPVRYFDIDEKVLITNNTAYRLGEKGDA